MATNLWEQEIDKTVDWGGDNSTGGAAVSGQYVQKFIKDTLSKKFGYLHYDRSSLKYFVFADEEDSNKYLNDTTGDYADLLLATFDAPAPASIQMVQEMMSSQIVTIISSQKNQAIEIGYIVKDSSNNPITESIQARIQFNNAGTIQTIIRTFGADFDNYATGTKQTINIDEYLIVGVNNISVTLTGLTTQATTTINFQYTVVELTITSTFDNKQAIVVDESKGTSANSFTVPYQINGNGTKYMSWWINGKQLHQKDWVDPSLDPQDGAYQATNMESYTSNMIIYLTNEMGELNNQFHYGKNTLQFYTYITYNENGIEKQILSEIKYYDFVIISKQSTAEETYILFSQDINSGVIFKPEDTIEFSTTQYSSTSFKYGLYSSSGMAVNLNFELSKTDETTGTKEVIANLIRSISSGEEQIFEYSFLTYGKIDIIITTSSTDVQGNPLDTLHIVVDVAKSSIQIEVTKDQLVLNLEALNRSNTEPNPATWEFRDIKAKFNNVLWNSTSGWDGKALVLNGGATCEIPIDVFNYYGGAGLTFEVDFEMVNVQDEDAVVLSLRDKNNRSFIEFTACAATMCDGNLELNTNFIDNRKMKVALIFNPDGNPVPEEKKYYSTMMIIVDGIMDRVLNQSANNIKWVDAENPTIVIGDPNAKAGIKVNSVRVYQKALTFDEELTNWIAESSDMLGNYNKNNVCAEGSSDISLDIVKSMAPTMVVYGDTDLLDNAESKSNNIEGDVEFYDPFEPELDFFARGAWISCQGTSSMMYPKKNWRLYFGKKPNDKTLDKSKPSDKMHWTEVYLNGEFTHGETNDFTKLGNFYCNKKTTEHKDSEGKKIYFHRLYCPAQAEELEKRGDLLYYKSGKEFLPCSFGDASALAAGEVYYVAAYRPLKDWLTVKEFRYSGCTLWKISGYSTVVNEYTGVEYQVPKYKKVKGKEALSEDTTYYVEQACWKQTAGSGWANRWTLKTDYAESSMCHNSGIARLWGNALKNFATSAGYEGRTNAQNAMADLKDGVDIRTSCDGKPIYMFACPVKRDDAGNPVFDENGLRQYEPAFFVGQFNIMTDKGSTALFGFEDIYDEKGNKIFDAENVECWEGSNNDDPILKFKTLVSEEVGNLDMGYRPIMASSWEPRWPDVEIEMSDGDEALVSHTMGLERVIRFLNFCMPAVRYTIDGSDGYNISQYIKIEEDEYQTYVDNKIILYAPTADSVETGSGLEYEVVQYTTVDDLYAAGTNGIYYKTALDMTKVKRELSDEKIESKIYKGKIATFDAKHAFYVEDLPFDDARVDEETGPNYGDPIKGSQYEEDYYTEVYLIQEGGNKFKYIDEYGDKKDFTGIRFDDEERNSKGESFAGKTYMEYFSEKKYDYFDIPKLAAYYVYIMRFCGVDQTVKNTMLTTEDGKHYYYINYDNDTTLGVRNDGQIVYHWTCDRTTYDLVKEKAAYAGDDSVLWNLLEMDEEFMNVVRKIDNALYSSNVLSTKIVVDYLNTKQKDVWCERTYNKQEERKYLSTWTSAKDPGYLKFCHGARDAHRTWFVTNRFNLFDSMWFSGEFNNHAFKFYVDITDATAQNPKDFFNLTAARKAVFGVTTSDLDGVVPNDWKIDLEMNETKLIKSIRSLNIISGPASMLGVDKIKTLDFSPLINGGSNLGQFIFDANHSEWWDAKGIMMTKLIFGVSDEYRTSLKHGYTNTTENPIEMAFGKDTVIIEPGKRYDSDIEVNNAPAGVEHNMLYPTRNNVYNLGSLNALRTLEELDIRNCFNDNPTYHYNDLEINGLVNLHIYRAIGSSITTFRPAEGCIFNEVSLPINRIEAIELNNCSFVKLEDTYVYTNTTNKDITFMVGETEVKIKAFDTYKNVNDIEELPAGITKEFVPSPELFKYTPDAILKNLVLKSVSGLDVKDMIDKWLESLTNAGVVVNPETGKLPGRTLSLQNVNLTDVPVDWVLNTITKFNYTAFTGKVKLIGSGDGGTLSEQEYNAIVEQYGVNVFNPTSNLVFDAPEGVFWTVTGAEKVVLGEDDPRLPGMNSWDSEYYICNHGTEYQLKATVFPISAENSVRYIHCYPNPDGSFDEKNNAVFNETTRTASINKQDATSSIVSTNGVGKFKSTVVNTTRNRDILYRVTAFVETPGKKPTIVGNDIYLKLNKIVTPTTILTSAKLGEEEIDTTSGLTITKQDTYKVNLKLKAGDSLNLPIDRFEVSMSDNTAGNIAMQIVNVTKGKTFEECSFEIVSTIQDVDITGDVSIFVNFESEYDVASRGLSATLPVTVKSIPATGFELYEITGYDEEGKEILSETPVDPGNFANKEGGIVLNAVDNYEYRLVQIPADCNIGIDSIQISNSIARLNQTSLTFSESDMTKLTISIKDNGLRSFDEEFESTITVNPIYNTLDTLEKVYRIDSSIIYPEKMDLRLDVKNENTSIRNNISMMNNLETYDKVFNLFVYSKEASITDNVTYPYTCRLANPEAPVHFEKSLGSTGDDPTFTIIKNGDNVTGLQVHVPAYPDRTDTIECSIGLIVEYKVGNNVTKVEDNINFTIFRTLATATSKMQINSSTFSDGETPCLLVDNNGNFYKIQESIIFELIQAGQIYNIMGIACYLGGGSLDPEKLIGIPLCSITKLIDNGKVSKVKDERLRYFWPSTWDKNNHPEAVAWDKTFSMANTIFAYKSISANISKLGVVKALYSSHNTATWIGSSVDQYNKNKWVPGYILADALCADIWNIGKSGNYDDTIGPESTIANPKGIYNFDDLDKASQTISSGGINYRLAMPTLYNFAKWYIDDIINVWGSDNITSMNIDIETYKTNMENIKFYIGSHEEHVMLSMGLNNILTSLEKFGEQIQSETGISILENSIYQDLKMMSLKSIENMYVSTNNIRFATSSLSESEKKSSCKFKLLAIDVLSNNDDSIKWVSDKVCMYASAEQDSKVSIIPFMKLK